ncbi:anti-sigma factor antagonist [Streptomyces sp. NPDC092369]|uniref:anti-sigma factor antagonist n=1 Tax=Streptomyces sp. NPDC092369 TaxID=3366015 RepID=UPI00381BB1C3
MPDRAPSTPCTAVDEVAFTQSAPSSSGRRPPLGIETHPAGDWTLVVVSGVLDIHTEQALHDALREALGRSVHGIDLDLSGVEFCDCSGLNTLLSIRRRALDAGRTVTIQVASTVVHRLLSITGTRSLFAVLDEDDEEGPTASGAPAEAEGIALGEADQDLRIELVQLRRAMQTRPVIDLARGVLMASFGLSAEDAWKVLVTLSQNTNTKLHQVADDLVGAVTGAALPESFQQQVAATVDRVQAEPAAPWGG